MLLCFRTETSREQGAGQAGDVPQAPSERSATVRASLAQGRAVRARLRSGALVSQALSQGRETWCMAGQSTLSPQSQALRCGGGMEKLVVEYILGLG